MVRKRGPFSGDLRRELLEEARKNRTLLLIARRHLPRDDFEVIWEQLTESYQRFRAGVEQNEKKLDDQITEICSAFSALTRERP